MTINIGNITIENPQLLNSIEKYSIEDIKILFVDFLKKEFIPSQTKIKEKSKWGEFATKMKGSFTPEMVEHLKKARIEARENFKPRNQIIE